MPPRSRRLAFVSLACAIGLVPVSASAQSWTSDAADSLLAEAAALAPEGRAVGLVLGVRSGDTYATYYATLDGGAGEARRVADHLVSPQAGGWWHLDRTLYQPPQLCEGDVCDISVSTIWAGRKPSIPLAAQAALMPEEMADIISGAVEATDEESAVVTAVAEGMVCWEFHRFRYTTHWAHPSTNWGSDCRWLDEGLVRDLEVVDARSVLDPAEIDRVVEALRGAYDRGEVDVELDAEQVHELGELDLSALTYFLLRDRGLWQGTALATVPAYYAMTPRYALFVEAPAGEAPANVTPANRLPLDFDAVAAAVPDLVDVLVAPTDDLVVVLAAGRLVGLDVAAGKVAFDIAAEADAVVMADWATGADAGRWSEALPGAD